MSVVISLVASAAAAQQGVSFISRPSILTDGSSPIAIASGDLDGDGNIDLAVANYDSDDVSVLWGNGDGTFTLAATTLSIGADPFGESPVAIAIEDIDGNGKPDIVTANESADTVSVLLNEGGRTFAAAKESPTGMSPEALAIGHFNDDGTLDVATPNAYDDTVTVLLGNGDGTFSMPLFCSTAPAQSCQSSTECPDSGNCSAQPIPVGVEPWALVAVDLNRDQILDLVVANSSGGDDYSGSLTVLKGLGGGLFEAQPEITSATFDDPLAIAVGQGPTDLNGDQNPDLVVVNDLGDSLSLLLGKGDLSFQDAVALNTLTEFTAQVAAASAGATALELQTVPPGLPIWGTITMIGSQVVNIAFIRNGNTLTLSSPIPLDVSAGTTITALTPSMPEGAVVADFNGDGISDIASSASLQDKVSVFVGQGNGDFAAPVEFVLPQYSEPWGVTAGDFNGDGKPDLATADFTDVAMVSVLLNTSPSTAQVDAASAGATTLVLQTVPPGFPLSGTITMIGSEAVNILFTRSEDTLTLDTPIPSDVSAGTTITAVVTPSECVGDCGGDGSVSLDEILTLVNMALGNLPVSGCEAADGNGDGQITVDEILQAVHNALNGCGT